MRLGLPAALSAALAVAGCQTVAATNPDEDTRAAKAALPWNYRQKIVDHVKKEFFDPYSIRDAGIAPPSTGVAIFGPVVRVCVRANAKNRMGGYTGLKAHVFIFQGDNIVTTLINGVDEGACSGVSYEPFPEIDAAPAVAEKTLPKR